MGDGKQCRYTVNMNPDPVFWLSGDDDEMKAAILQAQQSFPEFMREVEADVLRRVPRLEAALVKAYFFEAEMPDQGEHLFVEEVQVKGDAVRGTLSGTPQFVRGLTDGQSVTFPVSQISDWFLVTDGQGRGGYTLDVLARRMSPADYRRAAKYPPFAWFKWRYKAKG